MRGLSFKQSRRAEYDRSTALPCLVRSGTISVSITLSLSRSAATKLARQAEYRRRGLILEPPRKKTRRPSHAALMGGRMLRLMNPLAGGHVEFSKGRTAFHGRSSEPPGFATTSNIQMRAETG